MHFVAMYLMIANMYAFKIGSSTTEDLKECSFECSNDGKTEISPNMTDRKLEGICDKHMVNNEQCMYLLAAYV